MSRSSLAPWLGIPVVLAAGCAGWNPTAEAPDGGTVEERVRAPSNGSAEELQVFGLRNQAVVALERQATEAEASGELERAEMLLERALRIDGRDPRILQRMAEVKLARGRLDQAGSFASRAFELGPQVGEICERSLRTLIVVAERSQQWDQAQRTRERLDSCRVAPPERF